ncbi:MAG: PIG-L deacetylase family protein [Acidimicrobiales bacterium]
MDYTTLEKVDRVLVVMAHPDDVDYSSAGSIAKWTAEGTEVAYVIATDGDAGGFDRSIPREDIPRIRREEQTRAAKAVGVTDVTFLGYRDGYVEASHELRRDISREIRRFRPDRVVCQSPERNYQRLPASHPDHMATGEATLFAVYPDARNPFAYPELLNDEGLDAFIVREVLLVAHPTPTSYEDVTESFDRKMEALMCHQSQLPDPDAVEGMVRGWLGYGASEVGLGEDRLAEMFYRITL